VYNMCCNFFVMYPFSVLKILTYLGKKKKNQNIKHTQILSSSMGQIWSKSNEKLQHWPGAYIATKSLLNFQWEEDIPRNYELFEIVQHSGHFDYHNTLSASSTNYVF